MKESSDTLKQPMKAHTRPKHGTNSAISVVTATIAVRTAGMAADRHRLALMACSHALPWYILSTTMLHWAIWGESVAAVMQKGSVVYWDGQTYHAGGANRTVDQRRFAVTVDYCLGFLRTQENFIVAVGEEKAARWSVFRDRSLSSK